MLITIKRSIKTLISNCQILGGAVDSCTIQPALPDGLNLSKVGNSCNVSGSFEHSHDQVYTIIGSNETGSSEAYVRITLTTPLRKPALENITLNVLENDYFNCAIE